MGVVNTQYTFAANDVITSTKMNDIIDQTTVTGDAILGNTLEVAGGKLKVRSQGITSNELAANAVTNTQIADGSVTPVKLSTGAPNWDTSGNLNVNSGLYVTGSTTIVGGLNVNGDSGFRYVYATEFTGPLDGNANTATNLSTTRATWASNGTVSAVVGQLSWNNFGNNHTIFDASQGVTPSGTACNKTNSDVGWYSDLPTLMGWNGTSTHGVRVDSAKYAGTASTVDNASISAAKLSGAQTGTAPIYGARAWVNFNGTTSPPTIRSSGNIASVAKTAAGNYIVTLTNAIENSNYAVIATSGNNLNQTTTSTTNNAFVYEDGAARTSSSFRIRVKQDDGGSTEDREFVSVVVFG